MSVRIKVIQQVMPIVGKTERMIATYSDFDSDRSLSEFFSLYLPYLNGHLCNSIVFPSEHICQRKLVITIDYGDKDISDIRNEVPK